jgi:hypothetical protein
VEIRSPDFVGKWWSGKKKKINEKEKRDDESQKTTKDHLLYFTTPTGGNRNTLTDKPITQKSESIGPVKTKNRLCGYKAANCISMDNTRSIKPRL